MDNSRKSKKIIKTILFCLTPLIPLVAFSLYAYLKPAYYMRDDYCCWLRTKQIAESSSEPDYKVIAIGESKCNSVFVPQIISPDFYNFGTPAGSFVASYYLMETYLKNHKPPKVAFLMYASLDFGDVSRFWDTTIYFHYLTTEQEIDFFKTVAPMDKTSYEMDDWVRKYLEYKFFWPTKYLPAIKNAGFHNRKSVYDKGLEICFENRGRCIGVDNFTIYNAESYDGLMAENYMNSFDVCEISEYYLYRLIELLKKHNVIVIMEQGPVNELSLSKASNVVIQGKKEYFEKLRNKFNILVVPELTTYDDYCYLNFSHFNYRGAAKYSHYICERYADILGEFRTDKITRYNEILEYARKIPSENGLLETLNDDIFSLKIFVKNDLPEDALQNKILSEMKNVEFVPSAEGFVSPIETENFIIETALHN